VKYRIDGREKLFSVGMYPEVPLKNARERCQDARRLLAGGVDPSAKRKAERAARADTFEAITREWLDLKSKSLTERTHVKRLCRFEAFVFPYLGKRPISTITAPDLLPVLKRVEARGKNETAHRVRSESSAVFRYAIATGRAERDPAADLRGALAPVIVRNHPALTQPAKIGELLRAIHGYSGQPSTEYALKLLPLTFVRPGELRGAEWGEFDLDDAEWRIPAARMKMREQHLVPLATQAVELLRSLRVPVAEDPRASDQQQHAERRTAPAGIHRKRDGVTRIPLHGIHLSQRARLESGLDRAAAGPCREE
jgi:integrase